MCTTEGDCHSRGLIQLGLKLVKSRSELVTSINNSSLQGSPSTRCSTPHELIQVAINFTQPSVRLSPEYLTVPLLNGDEGRILLLHVKQQSDSVHKRGARCQVR